MSTLPESVTPNQLLAGSFSLPWSALAQSPDTLKSSIVKLCPRLNLPPIYIDSAIRLTQKIFNTCYARSKIKIFYHNQGHAQATLLHSLQAYIGSRNCGQSLDSSNLKLLVLTSLLHEVDDWWTRQTSPGQKSQIADLLSRFLYIHHISPRDFRLGIGLDNFASPLSSDLPPHLHLIGTLLRGADYCQCLDTAYLHPTNLILPDSTLSGRLGPFTLAAEFYLLRPKALVALNWADPQGRVSWTKVTPDSYFYHNHFLANFTPILPWLDSFYTSPSKNPYRPRQLQLEELSQR